MSVEKLIKDKAATLNGCSSEEDRVNTAVLFVATDLHAQLAEAHKKHLDYVTAVHMVTSKLGVIGMPLSMAWNAQMATLAKAKEEGRKQLLQELSEKGTFNDREEALQALRKMNDGKVYMHWHEEGGAIVHKCESEFFVFEVPIYGGIASFSAHLTRPEDVVELAFSWT